MKGWGSRLVAEGLSGERGGETIFSGIDFIVSDGEALIVTGPNGSGKSMLLRSVAGLLPPAGGSIRLEGGGEQVPGHAAACHHLGHENGMKPALSVAENLGFWQGLNGAPALGVGEALEAVGLETVTDLPYGYLSTGQRRRIAIGGDLQVEVRIRRCNACQITFFERPQKHLFTSKIERHKNPFRIYLAITDDKTDIT